MQIGILGAGGFIGSNLIEYLLDRGEHEVLGVDISDEKIAHLLDRPGFSFELSNIHADAEGTEKVIRESDVVVDLVAYANPSVYINNPLEVFRVNFAANMDVLQMCIRHGRRLIQYSTAEIYGKPAPGLTKYTEDDTDFTYGPINKQRWIYAAGKQLLERVIHAHGLAGELDYTIVRPFNFVGPRCDYLVPAGTTGGPRLFSHFMSALITGGPMYLVNGGTVRRSFTHIQDANEAFQVLLDHPDAHGQAFNIGNPGNDTTVAEVATLMRDLYEEITGTKPQGEIVEMSGEEFYGVGYEDNGRAVPDVSKLGRLGWQPTRGLRKTFFDAMLFHLDNPQVIEEVDLVERRHALAVASSVRSPAMPSTRLQR